MENVKQNYSIYCLIFLVYCELLSSTHALLFDTTTTKPTTPKYGYGFDRDNEPYEQDRCQNIETPPSKWTEQNIPNPQTDTCKCGRNGRESWVCNPNNLMTYDEANKIDEAIEKLRKSTGPCRCGSKECSRVPSGYGGYQPAVALLSALYVKSGDSAAETAEDFADYLRDDMWEYGACNDDFVILVSDQDRQIFIATGELTRQVVNDACVNEIIANNKKNLGDKRYGPALLEMIEEFNMALQKQHPCNKPMSGSQLVILLGVIGAGIVSCVTCGFLRRKMGWCPNACSGGGGGGSHNYQHGRRGSNASHHSTKSAKSADSGGGGAAF